MRESTSSTPSPGSTVNGSTGTRRNRDLFGMRRYLTLSPKVVTPQALCS